MHVGTLFDVSGRASFRTAPGSFRKVPAAPNVGWLDLQVPLTNRALPLHGDAEAIKLRRPHHHYPCGYTTPNKVLLALAFLLGRRPLLGGSRLFPGIDWTDFCQAKKLVSTEAL